MRILTMIVGVLLVLVGGATLFFPQAAQAAKEAPKGDGGHGEGAVVPNYVEIKSIILPIVDNYGVSQVISMALSLEVSSEAAAEKVRAMTPRLKDAYIQDMYGVLSKQAALKGGVIQVGYIKERLNKVSNRIMGDDSIQEVLLQVVNQRPI